MSLAIDTEGPHLWGNQTKSMPNVASIPPRVLLFDIDGTLLTADGAGRRALSAALSDVCGRSNAVEGIDFRGMTDALIIERALSAAAGSTHNFDLNEVYSVYLMHLEQELTGIQSARALPGVVPLLNALRSHDGRLAIGLGTGN